MKVSYLDCCADPDWESVKTILDTNSESEDLLPCKNCGTCWFHRFLEIISSRTTFY